QLSPMLPLFLLFHNFSPSNADNSTFFPPQKCYSCSSTHMDLRWPKDKANNLLYLSEFPYFANDSCDQVKNLLPVVDCANSYCVKIVIKEPPAKREACVTGGAVVRDCWSRVMQNTGGQYSLKPKTKNNVIRLAESELDDETVGYIYTCEGFLCNSSPYPISPPTALLLLTTTLLIALQ
ncbi:hypothetical protein PENTCL1PPCAC_575, partial [Pristionchus entomophagus]